MFVIQKSQICSQDECPERTVMQVLPIQGTFIVVCYLIILIFIKVLLHEIEMVGSFSLR